MWLKLSMGLIGGCALVLGAYPAEVRAGSVTVYVGYADSLRANAFFPNPWQGSPNTIFLGSPLGSLYDSGAILIQNNSGSAINVNSMVVDGFNNHASFNLWGTPGSLPNGEFMILTQTSYSNFDTSDQLTGFTYPDTGSGFDAVHPSTNVPQVHLTINGSTTTFADSGHILDTGGYDFATWGYNDVIPTPFPQDAYNESFQWRPIGSTGINNPGGDPPTPEPSSVVLLAIGGLSLAASQWRRRRAAC